MPSASIKRPWWDLIVGPMGLKHLVPGIRDAAELKVTLSGARFDFDIPVTVALT